MTKPRVPSWLALKFVLVLHVEQCHYLAPGKNVRTLYSFLFLVYNYTQSWALGISSNAKYMTVYKCVNGPHGSHYSLKLTSSAALYITLNGCQMELGSLGMRLSTCHALKLQYTYIICQYITFRMPLCILYC